MNKLIVTGLILLLLIGCSAKQDTTSTNTEGSNVQTSELLVSAAASLANSLDEVAQLLEQQNKAITITYNYGSSGALQHQIEQGAPVDLFFSAGVKQMEKLINAGIIDHENSVSLLRNELVVIVPIHEGEAWSELSTIATTEVGLLAMGELLTVPAGEYAKTALVNGGMWDSVKDKVVYAKDVRQVLTYVETGNVDAGIVYRTDALSSSKVKIAFSFDTHSYGPIEYPLGIVSNSTNLEAAKVYYDLLQSREVLDIFKKHGFAVTE